MQFLLFDVQLVEKVFVYALAPQSDSLLKYNGHKQFNNGILDELYVLRRQRLVHVLNCEKFYFAKGSLRQRMLNPDGYHLTVGGVRVL